MTLATMGFLGFFKLHAFDPDAYDKELTALTQDISKTRNQITGLSRKRKSVRNNIIYSLAIAYLAWIAYRYRVSLSNLGPLAAGKSHISVFVSGQDAHSLITSVIIPLIIAIVVYLVDSLFSLLISSKDSSLKSLLKRHRAKIDDLKRVTNFNTANQLLEKYGKLEARKQDIDSQPNIANELKKRKQNTLAAKSKPEEQNKTKLPPTINRPSGDVLKPQPPTPVVSQGFVRKTFQDRLLDYIIGSDHNESVESRYALICANCYTHNGLAPPGCLDPIKVTYICRQCGYINGGLDQTPSRDTAESSAKTAAAAVEKQAKKHVKELEGGIQASGEGGE